MKNFFMLILSAGMALSANAQLSLSSGNPTLSENFNSIGDAMQEQLALPAGWKIDRNMDAPRKVAPWDDASTNVMYYLSEDLSGTQSNGTYAFYASDNHSDRAIGGLSTGSVGGTSAGTRGISLMTKINNTDPSKILTNLNLKYNIEKYRTGNNPAGFSVRIFTSKDGNAWTEDESLIESFNPDGSTGGAPVVPVSSTAKNGNLRTHVEAGDDLYIAWNISVTSGTTCSGAQGLAIDDIEITGVFADTDDDWIEEEVPPFVASGIYLRGEVNGWSADTDWEFSKNSETEFILYNKTLSGSFKVADANWSSSCNYGSNGSNITMDSQYSLVAGTDTNISCGNLSFPCSQIILTIENGEATLKLVPNTSTKGLTAVYMVGDFNKWDYMSSTGKLTLDSSDNLFKGQVGLTAGEDGLSHWMIYQRLALAGAWGLESDATVATQNGTLVAGETGHVASAPGMYDVTFNLTTGEFSLTQMASTAQEVKISPAKVTLVPQNPETVKVLSLNNSLIHYNDQAKVFNDISASMNKDATWTKHTNLGKTLEYHWNEGDGMTTAGEPGAKMVIRSDAWSHIILQEQTALPRTDFAAFSNSVKLWVEYIRENCPNPNAVIILPLNWALGQDWSNFSDYNKILVDNYTKVAQEYGVVVCPVGIAYQDKYLADGGEKTEKDWFLPGDDRHPTLKATYMAALMEYGIIFNEDPTTVTYYPNYTTEYDAVGEMNDAIAAEMRQYASNALKAYENVVNHHQSTVTLKGSVIDQFNLEMNDQPISWSVNPQTASINDGVFSATEKGEYTVTATSGNLYATAVITIADALTEVPQIDFIVFDEDNLDYTQDFDSMGNEDEAQIPEGWKADGQLTERTIGTYQGASTTTMKAANGDVFGSTAKNGVWNFGDSSDLSDRALGGATTDTSGGAKSINIYAAFKNGGSKSISELDLAYNIEKYRGGSNSAGFTVQLYTSVDGRNWISAGNEFATSFEPDAETAGADVTPMETRHVTGTLNFDFVAGAELYLAWNISATSGTSCMSAPLLSIDDVEISATLKPVPDFDYHIYIQNLAGYEKTGLYAWGDGELFGSWPGQNPIDYLKIGDVTYEVFGHNQESGSYSLIYNNNNNGSQHKDYVVEGGKDYYFNANADGTLTEVSTTTIESVEEASDSSIVVTEVEIICPTATEIAVYDLTGREMVKVNAGNLNTTGLRSGLYIVTANTPQGSFARKFMKK